MTQYIDKAALVAEIKGKIRTEQGYSSGDAECGYRDCARDILSFLDTLEVKEVDLDKDIQNVIYNRFFDLNGIAIAGTSLYATVDDMVYIAKYFFELGLKAQKGE